MDIKLKLEQFHWHKDTRTLTAEVSKLELFAKLPDYITILNPNTNQSRIFRYLSTEKDDEGDIKSWRYENLSHGLKLTIWND